LAGLDLYKSSYYDHRYRAHRVLAEWREREATWNERLTGVPWSQGGASGIGADIAAEADGEAPVGWEPQWLSVDVTNGVREMSWGEANYGWELVPVSGNSNAKKFHAREETADPSRRPRLTLTYSFP
jgi:hypothetical protein